MAKHSKMTFWSLPLFIICDLFTFPLIHIGPIGWRISYVLILFISARQILSQIRNFAVKGAVSWSMPLIAATLILIAAIGHLIASISHDLSYGYDAAKNITYIAFMGMAYPAGKRFNNFNLKIIFYVFFLVIIVNLILTIGVKVLPSFVFKLYFPAEVLSTEFAAKYGIQSTEQLRDWYRPLGPHGSPTYSAFAVDVIYLFFVVAHLKNILITKGAGLRILVLISPIALSLVYSSRTEFVVSSFLSFVLYYHWYAMKPRWLFNIFLFLFILIVGISIYSIFISWARSFAGDFTFVDLIRFLDFLEDPLTGGRGAGDRFTLTLDSAWNRFSISPLFGTGFGQGAEIDLRTVWYYHNDVFFVLVTSGILGLTLYVLLIKKFVASVHPLLITPFVLPGLGNTFLLVFPMIIAYFFLLGIFAGSVSKKESKDPSRGAPE